MPSDPSGVSPRGVLVKPSADFFDDHLAYGGYSITIGGPAGNNFLQVSLLNNAISGVVLKVYGISAGSDAGNGMQAWVDMVSPLGTFVGACQNIRADQGAPYGAIYQDLINQVNPLPNPFTVPAVTALIGSSGFDTMSYFSPFPLFIIPVGYALHVVNPSGAGAIGASFWYQQANE
jgi:hypothetical protein